MSNKKQLESVNLLDLVPVRLVEWETTTDARVTLLRPKFSSKLLKKYLLPRMRRPFYRVYLDKFGSLVWNLCDGSTTVGEIGKSLLQKFGQDVEPVYDRLATFIRQLEKARFVKLPLPANPAPSGRQ